MNRFSRRSRAGAALLTTALMGVGGIAVLAAAPAAQAAPGHFSCEASVLRVQGKGPLASVHVEPLQANAQDDPCVTTAGSGLTVPLPTGTGDHVSVLAAKTTDHETPRPAPTHVGDFASSSASVLDVQVGGTLLSAQVLTSNARAECTNDNSPTLSGDSHVARVVLNGTVIEVPTTKTTPSSPTLTLPVPAPVGPVSLWLREENLTGTNITERALELDTGLVNIVISESKADFTETADGNPCTPDETTTTGGGCTGPETDPFVDPTAEGTAGMHPDCAPEFSEPKGDGDNTARDYVHFDRSINDTEVSPNGAFVPTTNDESRNRFYGEAGFIEDGDTMPSIKGKIYDDEDMHFRLAPVSIDAYLAPNDLAKSPWRRFCGVGVIQPFEESSDGMDMTPPSAPFVPGQMRKFLIETFDAKWLNEESPGGSHSDYFVIDIYRPGSDFDTTQCDPAKGDHDHGEESNPNRADLDYHSEGQTIEGNIEIHSDRVADDAADETTSTTMDDSNS